MLVQIYPTFSFSEPRSFLSSLFFNFPGASEMGRDEWKTNSLPEIPAACGNKREIRKLKKQEKEKLCYANHKKKREKQDKQK